MSEKKQEWRKEAASEVGNDPRAPWFWFDFEDDIAKTVSEMRHNAHGPFQVQRPYL